jgi:methylamine dehydrogenase accessory protein MauD
MSLWLVSYVALWMLELLTAFAVLVLVRQLGVLHLRFGPRSALALSDGPRVGTIAPRITATDVSGQPHELGSAGQATTIVFIAPDCPLCETILPGIRAVGQELANDQQIVVVTSADDAPTRYFQKRLGQVPVIASSAVGEAYAVTGTPYAVHIDSDGFVARKGVVNTLEQLEGLIDPRHFYIDADQGDAASPVVRATEVASQ